MLRLIRIVLLIALFFLLAGAVAGISAGGTGAVEKVVLALLGLVIVWLAVRVRRLGTPPVVR